MGSLEEAFTSDAKTFAKSYFAYLTEILARIDTSEIERFIMCLLDARERGSMVFFIGNGGSAATASHFANDLSIGTRPKGKKFRVMSLTDNQSVITAIANDSGYDRIFADQLAVLGKAGDVVVGISASGNSPNLLEAFAFAKKAGIFTIALTAFDGGKLKQVADQCVHVPTGMKEYGPAEDAHMILDHLVHGYLYRIIQR